MRVFISSTAEELEPYRAAARDVVLDLVWVPAMMEYFGTDDQAGVVEACARRVDDADLVLAIVGWRRGGVPGPGQGGDGKASYSRLELEQAAIESQIWLSDLCGILPIPKGLLVTERMARFTLADAIPTRGSSHRMPCTAAAPRPPELVQHHGFARACQPISSWYGSMRVGRSVAATALSSDRRPEPRMIGQTLSHYEIVEKLGEGAMGVVYLAEDTHLKRRVALKVLRAELASDRDRLERFQHEAEALARLNHPHIVTIYSVEEADGVRFLTMELVEGKSLDRLIPRGGMDARSPAFGAPLPAAGEENGVQLDYAPIRADPVEEYLKRHSQLLLVVLCAAAFLLTYLAPVDDASFSDRSRALLTAQAIVERGTIRLDVMP